MVNTSRLRTFTDMSDSDSTSASSSDREWDSSDLSDSGSGSGSEEGSGHYEEPVGDNWGPKNCSLESVLTDDELPEEAPEGGHEAGDFLSQREFGPHV